MVSKLYVIMVLSLFAAGCGVKAQTYVMTKERVDIKENQGGNAGYLLGSPQYQEPQKKSRKVYILELTKPIPESEVKKIEEEMSSVTKEVAEQRAALSESSSGSSDDSGYNPSDRVSVSIPQDDAGYQANVTSNDSVMGSVTYTVVKDDTLQKISKKFYNSYGKWMKIYDANKDKIKNPNFVKPGTQLVIPDAQEGK